MHILGLVTARGGSKGVPRKNLVPLAGKPLISWTIEAAMASSALSQVVVSTDDDEIASVCRALGARVPFVRPAELARDDSTHFSVVQHALRWVADQDHVVPDYVFVLQPTSPLRTTADIDAAVRVAVERRPPAVIGVCEADHHPFLVRKIDDDGSLVDFMPCPIPYPRRQDLPPAYALNGAVFLDRCEDLLRDRVFVPPGSLPYVMPRDRSWDVDTDLDLRILTSLLGG